MKNFKYFLLFFAIFYLTTQKLKLSKKDKKYKRKLELLLNKKKKMNKKLRKLYAQIILKIYQRVGVRSYIHHMFKEVWGGQTTVHMAREDPQIVINRYPTTQNLIYQNQDPISFNLRSRHNNLI